MPIDDPRSGYQRQRDSIESSEAMTDDEKAFIFAYMDAFDPDVFAATPPANESTREYGTLKQKGSIFKRFAEVSDFDVSEADANDVNEHLTAMKKGTCPMGPDDGYAPNTVKGAAMGLRVIYAFHGQIEKDDIALPEGEDTHVDEADMFNAEEIAALRDACPNLRDRAILELLINTGQRVRAVQTIRMKDLFLEEGIFRLNPTVDGLKGAEGRRPLLGAVGPVRRWKQQHPCGDDPEAYLITCLPRTSTCEAGQPITVEHIQRRMRVIGNDAGVQKPTNPHNFRHYFVTVCKRDYGLSDSQIKHLIGHRPDSNVMSTTYSHLTDDEIATNVAVEAGFKEDEDERSALSPPACTTCDEPLPDDAKACPICGTVFTPDAKAVEDQIEDMLYHTRAEADEDEAAELDRTRERIRNDPEFKAALVEELLED